MHKTLALALAATTLLAGAAFAADSYMVVPKTGQKFTPGPGNFYSVDPLLMHKNSQANVTIRDKNGQAEVHADWEDHIFFLEGEANLILGGTVENGKTTAPGETRGDAIKGGKSFAMHPGDYIYVPVNTPHQMMPVAGKTIRYGVVKTHP
ncbi:MAG TPA: hypothetical protein VFI23_10860 [Rhizomicrobium sp.]|nr:hypothetical protein [Rhizomicrobium sp.]